LRSSKAQGFVNSSGRADGNAAYAFETIDRFSFAKLHTSHVLWGKGFPHGMPTTETATINANLLALIKAQSRP